MAQITPTSLLTFALLFMSTVVLGHDNDVCFEMLSNITAVDLKEHPAGGQLAVATRAGIVYLMTRPPVGSGEMARVTSTFLNISDRVLFTPFGEQGFYSIAFHPQFASNGRVFVSYICDGVANPDCQGPCSTSALGRNCSYNTIVAEYSAAPTPLEAASLSPQEVRRVLRFGRPFQTDNGGQIWFGPDGYLWYASGDGGSTSDPFNSAQNGSSPLGKILRLDVDAPPQNATWGQYAIPPDNPFLGDATVAPEIYALGFRNPWRSSVDPETNVTFSGDVGQNAKEEVNVIKAGANYGWSAWEGTSQLNNTVALASPIGGNFTFPILEYGHPADQDGRMAVIGGYVYRADRNPCLQGQYIFGDESGRVYTGEVYEDDSNELLTSGTTENSTIGLVPSPGSAGATLPQSKQESPGASNSSTGNFTFPPDYLLSWAADSANELYRLSTNGVFRVVNSSACNFSCQVHHDEGQGQQSGKGARPQADVTNVVSLFLLLAMIVMV